MTQVFRAVYIGLILTATFVWMAVAQAPPENKQSSNYTGKVTTVEMNAKTRAARLHFEPGARTKWHTHEKGQLILCEEGVARHQIQGKAIQELHAGDTAYVPGGMPHWHGAAPNSATTLFSIDLSAGSNHWLNEVTEKEYTAPAK
jgi:quercetin dioxygenase-like cupin family protein